MNRRIEYRVVYRRCNGIRRIGLPMSKEDAENMRKYRKRERETQSAWIEAHEVVETDWEPLPEEEANG